MIKEADELQDQIARTAEARRDYLSAKTWITWFFYQDLYLALGRCAFCPRQGDLPGSHAGDEPTCCRYKLI